MDIYQFIKKSSQDFKTIFHELACLIKKIPTKTSHLTNDGENGMDVFITAQDLTDINIDESNLVHKTLPEEITGIKTFINGLKGQLTGSVIGFSTKVLTPSNDENIDYPLIFSDSTSGNPVSLYGIENANGIKANPFLGRIIANTFKTPLGLPNQFLKADGSIDSSTYSLTLHTHTFASLTLKPTTLSGYGITDGATTAFVTTADNLKANIASPTFTGTVGGITKAMVGLGSVDNTSDVDKPISIEMAAALNQKQPLGSYLAGTGTTNYLSVFTGAGTLGTSSIKQENPLQITIESDLSVLGATYFPSDTSINIGAEVVIQYDSAVETLKITSPTISISGNAGIGTLNPTGKLTVKGSGAEGQLVLVKSMSSNTDYQTIKFMFDVDNYAYQSAIRSSPDNYGNTDGSRLSFWTQPTYNTLAERMTIAANGNVGIAILIDNDVDRLQVNGTISANPATLSNQVVVKSQLDLKANLASPLFIGIPTAPTASTGTNTTQLATTAFVQAADNTLQTNINAKADKVSITGATKTKITYNAQGIVTEGVEATTADIVDSTNKRYVNDAQLIVVGNTSGINTGDSAPNSNSNSYTNNQISLIPAEKYLKNTAFYVPIGFDFATISSISQQTIIITNAHNLLGNTINLGANRIVQFLGGTFTNGTLTGTNCQLIADRNTIFPSTDVSFGGTWINDIYPEWWAANTTTDWQPALQKALDKAKLSSGKVSLASYLYQYYNQLTVHEGTSIFGTSRGDTAFGAGPSKGSVLRCLGNSLGSTTNQNIAIKVVGRMITLKDFTLRGERSVNKYGDGIVLYGIGDGSSSQALLENCYLGNLLIHGFQKGKGLCLVAGNSGSVTYSNFANIRIRDCAKHISIEALSSNPIYGHLGSTGLPYSNINCFINSNTFTGLYLSGYCETGIHVYTEFDELLTNGQQVFRPANNLIFNGLVVEPPYSSNSHIRIEGAGSSIRVHDIRVEASAQDANYPAVPVVYLGTGTNANFIDCDQMSVTIQDFGWNNNIGGHNQKNGNATPNTTNLYKNSAFVGLNKTGVNVVMPEWSIEEQYIGVPSYAWRPLTVASAITLNYTTDVVEEGYKVISVTVPPNYQFRMSQNIDRILHKIYNAKINAIVKATNLKDVIWTYQDSATPIISGGTVFGGSTFEPMGGFFPVTQTDISSYYRISVFCQNYTATPITFSITMPSFVTGQITPTLPAKLITENGGTFYGVTSHNVVKNIKPFTNPGIGSVSSSDIILPLEGNYFEIDEGGFSIAKINATVTRFGRGTVITLYFNYAGISIVKSAFLNIFKPFISEVGCTLTLQSPDGNGLWYELSRSERKIQGLYTGVAPMTGNILNLDTTCNVFNLNGFVSSISIIRINDSIKFNEGSQITLNFISPSGYVGISNSAYIALNNPVVYYPGDGDWIKLETTGNGTWYEIARKTKPQEPSYLGFSTVDASTAVVTNFLALPLTGEKYFSIINTSGATRTVTRINDILKFTGGSEIMLRFGTTALPITTANAIGLANSAYISLRYNTTYNPVTGDWIKLMTMGDGQWIETERKQVDVPFSTDGAATSNLATSVVTNFLTLVTTGENYFTITNTGASSTIQRINNASGTRLSAGKDITLVFGALTNTVTLVNSGYITLMYGVNYSPIAGDWMTLRTIGDGTWKEIDRIPSATPEVTTANKDATGGYAGLTLFKINFKNALNTFTSFFTNANTAARTYTFQDRDGTIADNTDLLSKANIASPTFTGIPAAPTPVAGTNTTQLATTAFVQGTKKIVVRKISTATLLADTDNCTVILLTASCTVTLPNGLMSGFNCAFATQSGATLTYSLGGSIILINNSATTMPALSTHTIANTGTSNEYLTVGL